MSGHKYGPGVTDPHPASTWVLFVPPDRFKTWWDVLRFYSEVQPPKSFRQFATDRGLKLPVVIDQWGLDHVAYAEARNPNFDWPPKPRTDPDPEPDPAPEPEPRPRGQRKPRRSVGRRRAPRRFSRDDETIYPEHPPPAIVPRTPTLAQYDGDEPLTAGQAAHFGISQAGQPEDRSLWGALTPRPWSVP